MKMRPNTIVWLWSMWMARRRYFKLCFSQRERFLRELRPTLPDGINQIAYPDAIFWIKPRHVLGASPLVEQSDKEAGK